MHHDFDEDSRFRDFKQKKIDSGFNENLIVNRTTAVRTLLYLLMKISLVRGASKLSPNNDNDSVIILETISTSAFLMVP